MKNASIFFIKGTRALVDHAAAAALISGAGRRSWPQHGPGAARHLIRRNGQGFPRPFSWRPVSGPHRGPEAARSRAGLICAAAATVQGALASRMQDGHVVVKIQCSLIPCRGRQAPVIQRGRVRASIAFMYPRPRKHRLCIHTPACLGYALKPYALREQHEDRARGPRSRQEPPRSHSRIPAGGFPPFQLAACLRAAQTPKGRLDAAHGPGWRLISAAAAARISGA